MTPVLYDSVVRHRRAEPAHALRHSLRYVLLDLDEVDAATARGDVPSLGVAGGRFRRTDYFDGTDRALRPALLDLVEGRTGRRPSGPVKVLTQLRVLGWLFNPITAYYCADESGSALDALVLEVTNTPWHERHWYVLRGDEVSGRGQPFAKALHVSPFMPMGLTYRCRASLPGERLALRIELSRADEDGREHRVFDADLTGRRVDRSTPVPRRLFASAVQTRRVSAAIYAHAAHLWRRGATFHRHPGTHTLTTEPTAHAVPRAEPGSVSRRIP
jgi:uncharacterized protein